MDCEEAKTAMGDLVQSSLSDLSNCVRCFRIVSSWRRWQQWWIFRKEQKANKEKMKKSQVSRKKWRKVRSNKDSAFVTSSFSFSWAFPPLCHWGYVAATMMQLLKVVDAEKSDAEKLLEQLNIRCQPGLSHFWVVVSNSFYFHPYLGKIPILTSIFQWVETTNEILTGWRTCCTLHRRVT